MLVVMATRWLINIQLSILSPRTYMRHTASSLYLMYICQNSAWVISNYVDWLSKLTGKSCSYPCLCMSDDQDKIKYVAGITIQNWEYFSHAIACSIQIYWIHFHLMLIIGHKDLCVDIVVTICSCTHRYLQGRLLVINRNFSLLDYICTT